MLDPIEVRKTIPLMFGGEVDLGFFTFPPRAMRVGTEPLGARIRDVPYFPEEWFIIASQRSQIHIIRELEKGYIPDWLRADCFEHLYNKLKLENK